jgi:hypothetical protein
MIKKPTKLYERWITFIKIVFDPWAVMLTIFLFLLIRYAGDSDKIILKYIYTLLVAIISMLLGALLMRKWIDFMDENNLVIRGHLAIRSLKLIYLNLIQTEKRTKKYIENLKEEKLNFELVKSNFEEMKEKCHLLQEECLNSIENWSDIIDEANVKSRLSTIRNHKLEEEKLEGKIYVLDKIMHEDKTLDDEKRDRLRNRMEQIEIELGEVRKQVAEKENEINDSVLSGMINSSLKSDSVYSLYKSCPSCGRFYTGSDICPFCSEPFTPAREKSN